MLVSHHFIYLLQYVIMATTFDGTTERVYINENPDKSHTMTSSTPVNANNRLVLGYVNNGAQNMDADVGFVLFYNRSLTASEISKMYNSYALRFSLTNCK